MGANEIKIFKEGTKVIYKKDISKDIRLIVIPQSVERIETESFYGIEGPILYVGTQDQFGLIDVEGDACTPCVYCSDGVKVLAI